MNINAIGHLVKTNPIQTQTKPIFKSEDRRQKTDDRRQRKEDRRQKIILGSEVAQKMLTSKWFFFNKGVATKLIIRYHCWFV